MRYFVAIMVSLVLIVLTFVFAQWMITCADRWALEHAVLPAITQTAVNAGFFIRAYWYLPVALYVAVPLVVAALWPKGKHTR
jgi:hypothetical protein